MLIRRLFFPQKSYEKVVYILRRHWITFLGAMCFYAILLAIPAGFYVFIGYAFPDILANLLNGRTLFPIVVLVVSLYYLSIWLFLFTAFIDYYLDLWTITTDRIVNIEQAGLFSRTISEADLYKIQDVTSEVKGLLPTIFNYGTVYIQTATEKERFVFEQVPNPNEIREKIIQLAEEDRKYHISQSHPK
jgi:ABC-type multidrug transport system fused ATPase/permease subunit